MVNLAPQAKLTGAAAALVRRQATSPAKRNPTSEGPAKERSEPEPGSGVSPNPVVAVFANPASRPSDAPAQLETSSASQKILGNIASAANAMDPSGSAPSAATAASTESAGEAPTPAGIAPESTNSTTDPSLLRPAGDGSAPFPLSVQPLRAGSVSEQLQATTPTTPGFSATTPTTPFSPSATTPGGSRGRHTCQHCSQTFTRHHNLKSHLLTHSHEKPFLCQTCQARFRRLHDLKRHSKLHTGERPHVCPKCARKFARGDALARHARAEGGCAGRRSSMAGVSEDGSLGMAGGDEDGMEGLEGLIDGDHDGDVDMIGAGGTDGSSRRRSLPSIRTDFSSGASGVTGGNPITPASGTPGHAPNQHHNTYPPLGNRANSTSGPLPAGLFPPQMAGKPFSMNNASPMAAAPAPTPTSAVQVGNGSILSPHGCITDSPRPVSPGTSAPQDNGYHGFQQLSMKSPPTGRPREAVAAAPTANMGGVRFTGNAEGVWAYIKGLEERVRSLEGTVEELREELKQKSHKASTDGLPPSSSTEKQALQQTKAKAKAPQQAAARS